MAQRKPSKSKKQEKRLGAYFLSLEVENVRCFGPRQRLDLSDGKGRPARWTVILGNNGVGKTTLLRALVAMVPVVDVSPNESRLRPLGPFSRLPFAGLLNRNHSGISIQAEWFFGSEILAKEFYSRPAALKYLSLIGDSTSSTFPEVTEFYGMIYFGYGAGRRTKETTKASSTNQDLSRPAATLLDETAGLSDPEEWLLSIDYAAMRSPDAAVGRSAAVYRDQVCELLVGLLPDVSDLRFTSHSEGHRSFDSRVEVKTPYGWVELSNLSWGYKTLVSWLIDLLRGLAEAYPDSANPLAEPAVVLLDEIDLHLHPRWQRTIIQYLTERFPNTQFIVTAHSPLVVQSAPEANLVVLRQREGTDYVEIDNDPGAVRGWRVDQILTSDLYGLPSARSPETEALLAEQRRLATKARPTTADRKRLAALDEELGALPTAERREDQEALDLIREAARELRGKKRP